MDGQIVDLKIMDGQIVDRQIAEVQTVDGQTLEVQIKVFRFNPTIDASPHYTSYPLPWTEGLTLLAAIRKIYTDTDPTLAFRNYFCGRGLCNGCRVTVNGMVKKACHVVLEPRSGYTVEPLQGYPVIRDLVVDFGIRR